MPDRYPGRIGLLIESVFEVSGRRMEVYQAPSIVFADEVSVRGVSGPGVRTFPLPLMLTDSVSGVVWIQPPSRNNIGWSKIGIADFTIDETADAGWMPLDITGDIKALLPLGRNDLIVYLDHGIVKLHPEDTNPPTYGQQKISDVGVRYGRCVDGDHNVHYFVDTAGRLRKLSGQGEEDFNYSEFLRPIVDSCHVFWDPVDRRVYISGRESAYIYTPDVGMGGGYANITGFARIHNDKRVAAPVFLMYPNPEFETVTIDFGRRGLKTIESLHVGMTHDIPVEVAVKYKYDSSSQWFTTPWKLLNHEGVAWPKVTANEFRILLRMFVLNPMDLRPISTSVTYINVNYKTTDQRFSRSALVGDISRGAFAGRL